MSGRHIDRLDLFMGELQELLRVVINLTEEPDGAARDRLRAGRLAILYLMLERTSDANRTIGFMRALEACGEKPPHKRRTRRRFRNRSRGRNR